MAKYLYQALELAQLRRGFCAPNPSVGAVVVKDGRILGSGNHWMAGAPHAEVAALADLSPEETAGATLYITLEPCCHWGKTPPCTDLIIKHQISQIVYGFPDPNPAVAGKGHQKLVDAGIDCTHMPLPEIDEFYASYAHWVTTGKPWVTAKLALSLDGCIAGENGEPMSLTGPAAQQFTHQQRLQADAILTTARTICRDNPQLNVRLSGQQHIKPLYVLDTSLSVPLSSRVCKMGISITLFYAEKQVTASQVEEYSLEGIRCIAISQQKDGRLSLPEVLDWIGQDGMHDLWVEAGGECFSALIDASLVQHAFIYVAPMWLGESAQKAFKRENDVFANASSHVWQVLGEDAVCEIKWPVLGE
jgi:diaminohydroxyphosphoribosylaminopyrimidine deaminase/5-amino-6-(5-phosphoribosylamino)uracil reductase